MNWKFAPLLSDFYKQVHAEQYPKGLTKLVSYFTPRMTRLPDQDFLIMFGLQGFLKEYLIENFNKNFFELPKEKVIEQYRRVLDHTLGKSVYGVEKLSKLHDLGYLPIEIKSLEEGIKCSVKVPMIEISNTHPEFAWCVNWVESILSCSLWYPMTIANAAYRYRLVVNEWWDKTVDNNVPRHGAISEFGMRGAESLESGVHASAAFLTSFSKTATIPAIEYLEDFYNCDCTKELVGMGGLSTEHSVMCSNYAIDGCEELFLRRLITEIYPNGNVSVVSDSYDFWNVVDNILPKLKEDILKRDGTIMIRPDSGDPVSISVETVKRLYNIFGGTINSKGYKVLDSHIRVIYGDSITPQRAKRIYEGLANNGFASNNIALGAGSFSLQCLEGDKGELLPFTRDTFGIAVKSTYGEVNGKPVLIFKDPKTDTGHFKKSQKGMCCVFYDDEHNLTYADGLTYDTLYKTLVDGITYESINELKTVFKNSKMVKETSLKKIRDTIWEGDF